MSITTLAGFQASNSDDNLYLKMLTTEKALHRVSNAPHPPENLFKSKYILAQVFFFIIQTSLESYHQVL
jgi:hypothetical protein